MKLAITFVLLMLAGCDSSGRYHIVAAGGADWCAAATDPTPLVREALK